jgi:transcriptional pleiotropic regulator of transition state genes
MKSTGIVRKVDELGRIVIPKELRTMLGVKDNDPMEIFKDGDRVILQKYVPGCDICGEIADKYVTYCGKSICPECVRTISRAVRP